MSTAEATPVRHFLRSSGVMAGYYAAAMVLAFASGIVLTRSLGAHGYGIYSLALTSATLVGLVTEFGLPVLVLREAGSAVASRSWGRLRGLMQWSDRLVVALSLILISVIWGLIAWGNRTLDSEYLATMSWAILLIPLVGLAKLRSSVLMSLGRVATSQFAVMIARPLGFLVFCLAAIAWFGTLSATTAIAGQLCGAAASLGLIALFYRRWRPPELLAARAQVDIRGWLSASLPMGMTEGLRLLQGQLALLLIGWLAGATTAGVYRGADTVMQLASVGASVVATAATPMFARLVEQGDRSGVERITALTSVAMVGGVLVVAVPIAFNDWLFTALFGQDFAASPPVFVILAVGLLATYSMGLAQALANMSGHHVLTTQSFLVTLFINLALGFALIPAHGAIGADVATAVSSACGAAWCAWLLWRRTGYNTSVFNPLALKVAMSSVRANFARLGNSNGGHAMPKAAGLPKPALRQRIAAHTPARLRKAVRMALNYPYRLGMWVHLMRELDAADARSRVVMWTSALAAPLTSLRNLDAYRRPLLFADIAVTVRTIGRFALRAGTDDILHVMTSREPKVRRLIESELQPGATFVDGGANIGFYALLAARRVATSGHVIAFEMMPDTCAILRRHVAENGPLPIEIVECALAERSGNHVTANVTPGLHGQASIVARNSSEQHQVSVETVTLDDALESVGQIDLIKLDLEGAEFLALSGAPSVLSRTRCLLFESNDCDPRIFRLLEAAGFEVEQLDACDFVARRV